MPINTDSIPFRVLVQFVSMVLVLILVLGLFSLWKPVMPSDVLQRLDENANAIEAIDSKVESRAVLPTGVLQRIDENEANIRRVDAKVEAKADAAELLRLNRIDADLRTVGSKVALIETTIGLSQPRQKDSDQE